MIVNSVRELRIGSKTKEVLLDEAPVKFYVEGYDNKGNVFSTLNSLVFKWDAKDRDDVVRMVKFRDSQFSVTSELAGLESKGLQGNMVLYEGIKTGSAQVSVRLMSKASKAAAGQQVWSLTQFGLLFATYDNVEKCFLVLHSQGLPQLPWDIITSHLMVPLYPLQFQ